MNPKLVVARVQRVILALAFFGGLYLLYRIDLLRVPAAGCSPVLRYSPGALLLLDSHPPRLYAGDVVLFETEGTTTLYLGVVEREEDGRFWILTDNPTCPGTDSDDVGWVAKDLVRGRALLALPW